MKGRLFTILSALSLVLCVAMVVLWARSSIAIDRVGICIRQPPDPSESDSWRVTRQYAVTILSGQIQLSASVGWVSSTHVGHWSEHRYQVHGDNSRGIEA